MQIGKVIKVSSDHIELIDSQGKTLADPMSLADYPTLTRAGSHKISVRIDSAHEEHKEHDEDAHAHHDDSAALDDEDILDMNGHRHHDEDGSESKEGE